MQAISMRPENGNSKILYTIRDIAMMLGVSENAIRQHLFRKTGFLPEPIRLSTKKLLWTDEQLREHFRKLTPPPVAPVAKIGRPTKREALAKGNNKEGSHD